MKGCTSFIFRIAKGVTGIGPRKSASVPGSHDRVVQKIGYWDDYQDSPSELGHKQTPNVCTVKQNRVFQALSR